MDLNKRIEMFQKELNLMNSKWKEFAISGLANIPDYFFVVPASSSGKYHPMYALGDAGLARHTKAGIYIGLDLLRCEVPFKTSNYPELLPIEEDISSMFIYNFMFHDSFKQGEAADNIGYTHKQHPIFGAKFIEKELSKKDINPIILNMIKFGILNHMGKWTYDLNSTMVGMTIFNSNDCLNKWSDLIHLADYIASRKYLDCDFEKI